MLNQKKKEKRMLKKAKNAASESKEKDTKIVPAEDGVSSSKGDAAKSEKKKDKKKNKEAKQPEAKQPD